MVGHVRRIFSKLTISPAKAQILVRGISQAVHWEELFFFAFMGWLFVPLIAIPSTFVRERFFADARPFKRSYTKLVADQIAQASRIGFVVYIVDILKICLQALGFKIPYLANSPHFVAQSLVRTGDGVSVTVYHSAFIQC